MQFISLFLRIVFLKKNSNIVQDLGMTKNIEENKTRIREFYTFLNLLPHKHVFPAKIVSRL